MDTTKETNEIGCYNLAGAIIRQALFDYQFFKKRLEDPGYTGRKKRCVRLRKTSDLNQIRYYFESSKDYLFSKNKLESWLEITGLDRIISISYIRHVAKHVDILGQKKLSETNFREMSTLKENEQEEDIYE